MQISGAWTAPFVAETDPPCVVLPTHRGCVRAETLTRHFPADWARRENGSVSSPSLGPRNPNKAKERWYHNRSHINPGFLTVEPFCALLCSLRHSAGPCQTLEPGRRGSVAGIRFSKEKISRSVSCCQRLGTRQRLPVCSTTIVVLVFQMSEGHLVICQNPG